MLPMGLNISSNVFCKSTDRMLSKLPKNIQSKVHKIIDYILTETAIKEDAVKL